MCKRLVETILLLCGRTTESTHPTKRCKEAKAKGKDCDDLKEVWSFQRTDEESTSPQQKGVAGKESGNGKGEEGFTEDEKEELRRLSEEVEWSNNMTILGAFQ